MSRRDVQICDSCKKVESVDSLLNWFSIDTLGHNTRTFGETSIVGEYCSVLCVMKIAEAHFAARK